ncbi:unnamed protein product [Brachionus calyciflorus]|uniref:Uncharacterized protein n=1 Tax=Brachionus calyciflorus TaxID=104777 RepID=A0A813W073_9BILA|nr:unnamed protein product [Brachionus calyciflorus]
MIESINSMRIISINKENWKQSRCTCSHVIACSYRLRLMIFKDIGMDVPIERKRKVGASKKNVSCYNKQPSDVIESGEGLIEENDNISEDDLIRPSTSKKAKLSDQDELDQLKCKKCNEPLKKRRYYYCVNNSE